MKFIKKIRPLITMSPVVVLSVSTAQANQTTGYVDVYVDHSYLDEALSRAESVGATVIKDPTIILTGDAETTVTNTERATSSYRDQVASINQKLDTYQEELETYNAELTKNREDAEKGNAFMTALQTNLAANNQTVVLESKQFVSETDMNADIARIQASIAKGDLLQAVQTQVGAVNAQRNAMVDFTTQSNQGNITLITNTRQVRTVQEAASILQEMQREYQRLQTWLATNPTGAATGGKPTYTLFELVVHPDVIAEGTAPVTVFNYTIKPTTAVQPQAPIINYHLYDVRSTPTNNQDTNNRDDELIKPIDVDGSTMTMVMPSQYVSIKTNNQPIPAGRFDKFHDLAVRVNLPEGVEFKLEEQVYDKSKWVLTYDESTRVVTYKASDYTLLSMNQNAAVNNGQIGGTITRSFAYQSPNVIVKVGDTHSQVYTVNAETMVNHEYLAVSNPIQIRVVDPATPVKVNGANLDGKLVFPGTVNNYKITWDFDQYRGVNVDRTMQAQGLFLVDDFPEEAVDVTGPIRITDAGGTVLYSSNVTGERGSFVNANGEPVDLTWEITDTAPDGLADVTGKVLVIKYTGVDTLFYKEYVEKGAQLSVHIPMTTRIIDNTPDEVGGSYNGNTYVNKAYQIDYNKNARTLDVVNTVVKIDPRKDAVLSFGDLSTVDIKKQPLAEIEHKSDFYYRLTGTQMPTNLSEDITYYGIVDEFAKEDQYTGEYIIESGNDIVFKAGTSLARRYGGTLSANSDLTKYTTQTIARNVSSLLNSDLDTKVTRVRIVFDQDFLDQVDFTRTSWQVDTFLKTTRLLNVDGVKNVYKEAINTLEFDSNEVVTNTVASGTDQLRDDMDKVKEDVKDLTTRMGAAESALTVLTRELAKRPTREEVTDLLAPYVAKLNDVVTHVNNLGTVVNNHADMLDKHNDQITKVTQAVGQLTTGLSSIIDRVDAIEPNITTVEIYDASVTDKASAINYMKASGVPEHAIVEIKTVDGRQVVKYDEKKLVVEKPVSAPTPQVSLAHALKGLSIVSNAVNNALNITSNSAGAFNLKGSYSEFTAEWTLGPVVRDALFAKMNGKETRLVVSDKANKEVFSQPISEASALDKLVIKPVRSLVVGDELTFSLVSAELREDFTRYIIK